VAPFALLAMAVSAVFAALRWRRRRRPAHALIVSPRHSTVIAEDGAVRSVQSVELTIRKEDLERIWHPASLQNLARTYWRFLSRVTLGLIRVRYGENDRSVALLFRPLTLLRFGAPEYLAESEHGNVTWRIHDGLLVARAGRGSGYLSIDVRRLPNPDCSGELNRLRVEVTVANFYPAIAAGFSTPVYEATQSSIHVLVTHAFLRSLAKLDLAESKMARFEPAGDGDSRPLTDASPQPATAGRRTDYP
jgi:hypothetical protein